VRQEQFTRQYQQDWQELSQILDALEGHHDGGSRSGHESFTDFPARYRRLCQHLAQAQARGYSPALVDHLNSLVLRGHHQLYRERLHPARQILEFVVSGFPRLVRTEKAFVLAAVSLFLVPAIAAFIAVRLDPNLIFSIFDPDHVSRFESMYDPSLAHLGIDRAADTDFHMFGYYIFHNISIAFRCFAGGLFLMVGAVAELLMNGLILGGLAAHMQNLDYHETFFPFVIGHSAFELTAICLAGAAGMRLGAAVVAPGNRSRLVALREAAGVGVRLLYGVTGMLLIAAFIEAFWSSDNAIAPAYRLGAGLFLWLSVALYFALGGRARAV